MSKFMSKFIKILFIIVVPTLLLLASGCAMQPSYTQASPSIKTVRDSGFTTNTRRAENRVRYNPYTTLEASMKQAGDVVITVIFDYSPPRRGRQARTGRGMLHIKSSDSALSDVIRCKVLQAGNTFIVSLRTSHGERSFDLRALGGKFENGAPVFYSNAFISIGFDSMRKRTLRYVYVGKDPFNGDLR